MRMGTANMALAPNFGLHQCHSCLGQCISFTIFLSLPLLFSYLSALAAMATATLVTHTTPFLQ